MGILNNLMEDARYARRDKAQNERLEELWRRNRDNAHEQELEAREKRLKQDERWEEKRHQKEEVREEERKYREYLDFLSETPNIADDKEIGSFLSKLIPLIEKKNHWNSISQEKISSLSKQADSKFREVLDILISMHPESKTIDFFNKKYDDWHYEERARKATEEARRKAVEEIVAEKKRMRDATKSQQGGEQNASSGKMLLNALKSFAQDSIDKVSANAEVAVSETKSSLLEGVKGLFNKSKR